MLINMNFIKFTDHCTETWWIMLTNLNYPVGIHYIVHKEIANCTPDIAPWSVTQTVAPHLISAGEGGWTPCRLTLLGVALGMHDLGLPGCRWGSMNSADWWLRTPDHPFFALAQTSLTCNERLQQRNPTWKRLNKSDDVKGCEIPYCYGGSPLHLLAPPIAVCFFQSAYNN